MLAPALALLLLVIAYPFGLSLYLSLTDKRIGMPGEFIGFSNYLDNWYDDIFRQTLYNSILYTAVTVILKTALGLPLALALYHLRRGQAPLRAVVLLPWVVPTSLSAIAWWWIFSPEFGTLNWLLMASRMVSRGVPWLSEPLWARTAVMMVNTWRGVPFFAISFLAGLVAIPRDVFEAAAVDGAGGWTTFWRVTLPLMRPVLLIVLLYSTVMTISDFEIIFIVTQGGPLNSTHLFGTLAYQVGLAGTQIGRAASIALFIFPVLAVSAGFMLRDVLRRGDAF
jgi:multiple sugar transport system permease protein